MLTNNLLSFYNHLLATSLLYLTIVDPLQEISNVMNVLSERDHGGFTTFALANTDEIDQDYYEILGVKKDATKHDIHKAFRTLAKKYHPDRNKEKGAQDQFIKIFKAYETLNDEKKRKEYDSRGQNSGQTFNSWPNGMGDFDINSFFKQYEEQMYKHAQHFQDHHDHHHNHHHNHHHYQQHNNNHQKAFYHGVDLDDLFHDIDEDEFGRLFDFSNSMNFNPQSNFDGSFGDGNSFFGNLPSYFHESFQQGSHKSSSSNQGGYTCHTTTRVINGAVMTQTSCG